MISNNEIAWALRTSIDVDAEVLRNLKINRPPTGWISAIRTALGMPKSYLAKKLKINPSTLARLEDSEKNYSITLSSLQRIANELDCQLFYALVPNESLQQTLINRANKIISEDRSKVAHTMNLEGQGTKLSAERKAVEVGFIVASRDKRLWK
jgi:predicted DNA-binding mobile mystery protein A